MTTTRTRLRRILLGSAAAALALGTVLAFQHTRTPATVTQAAAGDAADPPDNPCQNAGRYQDVCRFVTIDGTAYRYALVPGAPTSRQATVLDVGGPGESLFGQGWPTGTLPHLRGENVIVLDEPWVTAPYPADCSKAVTGWYRTLRDTWPVSTAETRDLDARAATLADTCDLFTGNWGWTPDLYRDVLAAIETETGLRVTRFVGYSFGSQRAHYLGTYPRTVDLLSPFPYGTDASRYLTAREAALPDSPALTGLIHERVPNRSLPVTRLDVAAARIEAQYLPPSDWTDLTTGPDTARTVGQLSDMLFGRYGKDTLSPALLGYWAETCPALTGWNRVENPHLTLLGAFTGPCRSPHAEVPTTPGDSTAPACVVTAIGDGVVPGPLVDAWLTARGWVRTRSAPGPHAAPDLLDHCPDQDREPGGAARTE